jgi:hypothetical protein
MRWYVQTNGQASGPVETYVVLTWIRERRLGPDTVVAKEGAGVWVPLGAIPEFSQSMMAGSHRAPVTTWYHSTATGVLSILFCWPLGLLLLATNPRVNTTAKLLAAAGVLGLSALAGVAISLAPKHPPTTTRAPIAPPPIVTRTGPSSVDAWVSAQEFVRRSLKSPSTADFGSLFGEHQDSRECCHELSSGDWLCRGWVDAQNAFGAKARADFSVTMRSTGNGSWTLTEEPIIENR